MLEQLPHDFVSQLTDLLPNPNLEAYEHQFHNDLPCVWRINWLKELDETTMHKHLAAAKLDYQPHPEFPWAYYCRRAAYEQLQATELWQHGLICTQGLSSMMAARILSPSADNTVLDMTAAPGGKTQHLAEHMENRGELSAVEMAPARYQTLKANLDRWGVENTRTFCRDARALPRACDSRFDRILLDAPCSSEAGFRADRPNTYAYWSPQKVREMQRRQRSLLKCAWRCLKPGGRLLYATCTFSPEENELQVDWLLRRYPDACPQPIELPTGIPHRPGLTSWRGKSLAEACAHSRRILPSVFTGGFFLALLEKSPAPTGGEAR